MVNHKDGDPENNDASNLEWVTQKENVQHSVATGLRAKGSTGNCRPIRQINPTGDIVREFASIVEASKITGIPGPNIVRAGQSNGKHCAGWLYVGLYQPTPPLGKKHRHR